MDRLQTDGEPRSGRFARGVSKAALALLSAVVAILAVEALLRVAEGPPLRTVDGVVLWSTRTPRCDGTDIRRAAHEPTAFTIVGLGDSIMYGVGQPKEKTYLERVRRVLAGRSTRAVQVLNLAIPGYNTSQEAAAYKELDGQIRPDLVLVHFWGDDAQQYATDGVHVYDTSNLSSDGRSLARAFPLAARLSDFLMMHSRIFDDVAPQAVLAHAYHTTPPDAAADRARMCAALAEIDARVQRAGGRLLVLSSPALDGALPEPNAMLPFLRACAAPRAIEVIDLSEWLRGVAAKQIAMDACHFNEEGHRRVGERLAEYLLQHDLKEWQASRAAGPMRHEEHEGREPGRQDPRA